MFLYFNDLWYIDKVVNNFLNFNVFIDLNRNLLNDLNLFNISNLFHDLNNSFFKSFNLHNFFDNLFCCNCNLCFDNLWDFYNYLLCNWNFDFFDLLLNQWNLFQYIDLNQSLVKYCFFNNYLLLNRNLYNPLDFNFNRFLMNSNKRNSFFNYNSNLFL